MNPSFVKLVFLHLLESVFIYDIALDCQTPLNNGGDNVSVSYQPVVVPYRDDPTAQQFAARFLNLIPTHSAVVPNVFTDIKK